MNMDLDLAAQRTKELFSQFLRAKNVGARDELNNVG